MTLTGVITERDVHEEFARLGLVRVDGLYCRNTEGELQQIRHPHSVTRGDCGSWGQTQPPNDYVNLLVVIARDGTLWATSQASVNYRAVRILLEDDLSFRGSSDSTHMDELASQIAGIDSHRLLRRMADPRDREC